MLYSVLTNMNLRTNTMADFMTGISDSLFSPEQYPSSVAERTKEQDFNNPIPCVSQIRGANQEFSSPYYTD